MPMRISPERFKVATAHRPRGTATAAAKLTMYSHTLNQLKTAGYVYVGMDHFALPDDALAVAKRQGVAPQLPGATAPNPTAM